MAYAPDPNTLGSMPPMLRPQLQSIARCTYGWIDTFTQGMDTGPLQWPDPHNGT